MCLCRFVAFCVPFNHLCCWTQGCGLLSCIDLRVTDQSLQTGPNESALHFEVVFVVCWHQIWKLVKVVLWTVLSLFFKYTTIRYKFVYWRHWDKSSNWIAYLACIYRKFWKDCWQNFVSLLHLCVWLDLLHFVSLLASYAVAYCHAYI